MKNLLKEPLLHFVLIGVFLFVIYDRVGDNSGAIGDRLITVSEARITQLTNIFAKTWQRPPTPGELKGLIDDYVLEEIYYRQAIAMGIDRDDTVIRRRLRQKFEFLTDDVAASIQATDEDLTAYLASNPQSFRPDNTYSFEQVLIIPDDHPDDLDDFIESQLAALNDGSASPRGGLLPPYLDKAPTRVVDGSFGSGFSARLDDLTLGEWLGPVESGIGLHLIRIDERVPGIVPELAVIRDIVEREWANENRLETRRAINARLVSDYDVVVEWPAETASQ